MRVFHGGALLPYKPAQHEVSYRGHCGKLPGLCLCLLERTRKDGLGLRKASHIQPRMSRTRGGKGRSALDANGKLARQCQAVSCMPMALSTVT
eukprot:364496-Chlamydomonas_euryale.AAC.5